jgi:hypothetical protein
MAIIKNRVTVYKEQIQDFENQKADVNTRLMDLPEGPEADNLKQQLALLSTAQTLHASLCCGSPSPASSISQMTRSAPARRPSSSKRIRGRTGDWRTSEGNTTTSPSS